LNITSFNTRHHSGNNKKTAVLTPTTTTTTTITGPVCFVSCACVEKQRANDRHAETEPQSVVDRFVLDSFFCSRAQVGESHDFRHVRRGGLTLVQAQLSYPGVEVV
jgi:hypothetical protein